MILFFGLTALLAVANGVPNPSQRIAGGSVTDISYYPSTAALLFYTDLSNFQFRCGSTILNSRNLLTIAGCVYGYAPARLRVRVGSSNYKQNGGVYQISSFVIHPSYNSSTYDCDIAVVHTASAITYGSTVQPASIASSFYDLRDNEPVWIAGWGITYANGYLSEKLRDVLVWTVNQSTCSRRHGSNEVTANMLCAGWLDVGGRDACPGDGGSPLYHNGVVIGLSSWGETGCAQAYYPGVYTRVSRFTTWIVANIN